MTEQVLNIDSALETSPLTPIGGRREIRAVFPVCAELIILLPLFGIAEYLVGFLNLFKLLFGLFVVGIQIRMVLAREFPVRFLNLVFLCGTGNSKDFVIIAKLNRHAVSLLYSNFQAFTSCDHMRMELLSVIEDLFKLGILVMRIVVVKSDTFDTRFDPDLNRLLPAAVAPSNVIRQFFRCVLSIDDEEVGVFCQSPNVLVAPVD